MAGRYGGPAVALARYVAVVRTVPGLTMRGADMPYTARNGHMFSFLDHRGSMGLRLPPPEREEFIERYETDLVIQFGVPMTDFVEVPSPLLAQIDELLPWFARSHRWVGTLKPMEPALAAS